MAHDRLTAGTVLGGRFVLENLAGSGGMGDVYRAQDRETAAPVAVKVLHRADAPHASRGSSTPRSFAPSPTARSRSTSSWSGSWERRRGA
jgi:hypothetical protein